LVERPKRRRFSAEYKLQVVREADACTQPGEIGALLRREALYSSHLVEWRRARDAGALERPRGRKPPNPLEAENAALRRRAERAEAELVKAKRVIEVQGNVSALLGELLTPTPSTPSASACSTPPTPRRPNGSSAECRQRRRSRPPRGSTSPRQPRKLLTENRREVSHRA
jgi:transposase